MYGLVAAYTRYTCCRTCTGSVRTTEHACHTHIRHAYYTGKRMQPHQVHGQTNKPKHKTKQKNARDYRYPLPLHLLSSLLVFISGFTCIHGECVVWRSLTFVSAWGFLRVSSSVMFRAPHAFHYQHINTHSSTAAAAAVPASPPSRSFRAECGQTNRPPRHAQP